MSSQIAVLKKISPKTVIGAIAPIVNNLKNDGDQTLLYRITGIVSGTKSGETNFGVWTSFRGRFMVENPDFHGTTICAGKAQSSNCFIPEPVEGLLITELLIVQNENPKATLQIIVDVYVAKRVDSARGYEYVVVVIKEFSDQENDPLIALANSVPPMLQISALIDINDGESED